MSIKLHKFCLTIPELQFIYEKRIDGYLFIAGDPEDIINEFKDDMFLAQGIIPFKYYHEIEQKIKKEAPNTWLAVSEENLEDHY